MLIVAEWAGVQCGWASVQDSVSVQWLFMGYAIASIADWSNRTVILALHVHHNIIEIDQQLPDGKVNLNKVHNIMQSALPHMPQFQPLNLPILLLRPIVGVIQDNTIRYNLRVSMLQQAVLQHCNCTMRFMLDCVRVVCHLCVLHQLSGWHILGQGRTYLCG